MILHVDNLRKEIYCTGRQDLRELNMILSTYERMDILEEFIVVCGGPLPKSVEDSYDYTVDLNDENTKNINFA